MGFFQGICNQTVLMVILITSFFSTLFFFILYMMSKERGILMLFFANLSQIALTVTLIVLARSNNEWALVAANTISVVVTVFWINAFFVIFNVKCSYLTLVAINSFAIFIGFVLYWLFRDSHIVVILTTMLITVVAFFGAVKCALKIGSTKKTQEKYSVIFLAVFGALNLVRATYRAFNKLDFSDFAKVDDSATMFLLFCYGLSLVINYSILYINYEGLVNRAEALSCVDKLTGTLSRGAFFEVLSKKLAEVRRGVSNICLALLDIDNFKQINDTYGHLAGDQVLRCFTDTIKKNIRKYDVIGRYGGEEFILILQSRNCNEAKYALERIQKNLGLQPLIHDEHVTFSCGHMFLDKDNCDMPMDDMIQAIDAKMYEAKALGKDMIV